MAKQPEDLATADMFGPIGHTSVFGRTGSGKTAQFEVLLTTAADSDRVRRIRESRKLFPTAPGASRCEICGTRHHGPCQRTRWGGK